MKLTESQQKAVNKMNIFLESDNNKKPFTLSGVGGAGKTTIIKHVISSFNGYIVGATIAHSAKDVLGASLNENMPSNKQIPCFTIAQLLRLKQVINEQGDIEFIPDNYAIGVAPIASADLIIIDECSMIDEHVMQLINNGRKVNSKIIYMGDVFQLPPVSGKNDSPTFDFTKSKLHDSMRYGGIITNLGNRIRNEINLINEEKASSHFVINKWNSENGYHKRTSYVDEDGCGIVFLNNILDVINISAQSFYDNPDNVDCMRVLAYRNKTIKLLNDGIREKLYTLKGIKQDELKEFMPNELVICDGGYALKRETSRVPIIDNNEIFKVKEIHNFVDDNQIACFSMFLDPKPFVYDTEKIKTINREEGRHLYYAMLNEYKRRAKENSKQWKEYYSFKDSYAYFNYAYALSIYKAQGRTFDNCIVIESDILDVKMINTKVKLQALYVACTRAKKKVFIYNKKYDVDQSNLPESLKKELSL